MTFTNRSQQAETGIDQLAASYEEGFVAELNGEGGVYGDSATWPALTQAAHERRVELLDQLPIGDVSDKVCVDYGVGCWGFACIYPRLQHCKQAIGIDISKSAVEASRAISEKGNFPYGKKFTYLTSRGDHLDLPSQSVDVFFSGESIEHVENTEAFLDEIHRVLRPDGFFILTTPNADAYLYRAHDEEFCVGPEHVALMGYQELCRYLSPRFDTICEHGYNSSIYGELDGYVRDLGFAKAWAAQCTDQPDKGNGIIMLTRRRNNYISAKYRQTLYHHESPAIRYEGVWETMSLHRKMTGYCGLDGESSVLTMNFEGTGLILHFWCHDWSGEAVIEVDGVIRPPLNLYSRLGGFRRLCINDLPPGTHNLRIRGSSLKPPRSKSNQIIFYQATSFSR